MSGDLCAAVYGMDTLHESSFSLLLMGSNFGVRGWAYGLNVGMYRDFVINEVCLAKEQFAAHVAGSSITQIDTLPRRSPGARRHLHGRYTWLRITFGFGRIWLLIMNGRIFDISLWVIIPFFVVLRVSILAIHCLRSFLCEDSALFIWVQAAFALVFKAREIFFRSSMNIFISAARVSESGERRIEEGWTVAITKGASGDFTKLPRSRVTLNCLPSSAWAAVAPRHTRTVGCTLANSASSHGRQALISEARGFL